MYYFLSYHYASLLLKILYSYCSVFWVVSSASWLVLFLIWPTWEEGTQWRDCIDQIGFLNTSVRILLIANWCRRASPLCAILPLGSWPLDTRKPPLHESRKRINNPDGNHHSFVAFASSFYLELLSWVPWKIRNNLKPNNPFLS